MASFRKRYGTWEYRVYYKDKRSGKAKEITKRGFATKKEAQLAAGKVEAEIEYYGFVEEGKETVNSYMERWFKLYKEPHLKQSSIDLQKRVIERNIIPRWGNYYLKDITRNEYREWLLELLEHYSEGTIRRIHSIFNSALNDAAHEYKVIRDNPLARMKIPKKKLTFEEEQEKKVKFFTVEELDRFLVATRSKVKNAKYKDSDERYVMFYLISRTGLRIGECLALTWDDINFEEKTLTVNKTVRYRDYEAEADVTLPKTKSSIRTIELSAAVLKTLELYAANQKSMYMMYPSSRPGRKKRLVFHNWDGNHWRASVVREHFKEICKRANVPVLSPHALRHTHAVHLLEAGANIKYVSERLGHATINETSNTYLHITKKIERDALDLYEKHMKM